MFSAEHSSGSAGRYISGKIVTCGECSPGVRSASPVPHPYAQTWVLLFTAHSPAEYLAGITIAMEAFPPGHSGTTQNMEEAEHGSVWAATGHNTVKP